MLPFAESVAVWSVATLASALVGLALVLLVSGSAGPKYLASFGLGIFLWFFLDTVQGSSDLVVGEGFGGGLAQAAVVILFLVGALAFFWAGGPLRSQDASGVTFPALVLAALALGLHGLGEGLAFGATAAQSPSSSLLSAFGGVTQGVAYALHKMIEPMMVGALYVAYAGGKPATTRQSFRDISVLALAFVVPSIVGGAVGYFSAVDTTYAYALGAGASVYVAFRLSGQVFSGPSGGRRDAMKVCLSFLVGFILIYLAALLHS